MTLREKLAAVMPVLVTRPDLLDALVAIVEVERDAAIEECAVAVQSSAAYYPDNVKAIRNLKKAGGR